MKTKLFNIDEVKNGAIAVTQYGVKADIFHIDEEGKTFLAWVSMISREYDFNGRIMLQNQSINEYQRKKLSDEYNQYNLSILETANEYWINICQNENGVYVSPEIFHTKQGAIQFAPKNAIKTILAYQFYDVTKTHYTFCWRNIIKGKYSNEIVVGFNPESFEVRENAESQGKKYCEEKGYEFLGVSEIQVNNLPY